MSKRVVTSALCVIPPSEIWAPIQEIRSKYDKAYPRWMPHINFVYPFVETSEFVTAENILKDSLCKIEPFKVTLAEFGYFSQKGQNLIFLDPDSSELKNLFKCVDKHYESERREFHAHMTVAQFPKDEFKKQMELLEQNWKPCTFEVKELYIISRDGKDDPFQIRSIIPLKGHKGDFNFKIVPLPEKKEIYSLFVGNLAWQVTESDVFMLFADFKPIKVQIPKNKEGQSRGFAFVEFESEFVCEKAMSISGTIFMDRKITIDFKK